MKKTQTGVVRALETVFAVVLLVGWAPRAIAAPAGGRGGAEEVGPTDAIAKLSAAQGEVKVLQDKLQALEGQCSTQRKLDDSQQELARAKSDLFIWILVVIGSLGVCWFLRSLVEAWAASRSVPEAEKAREHDLSLAAIEAAAKVGVAQAKAKAAADADAAKSLGAELKAMLSALAPASPGAVAPKLEKIVSALEDHAKKLETLADKLSPPLPEG
jgi:hypothetical protein